MTARAQNGAGPGDAQYLTAEDDAASRGLWDTDSPCSDEAQSGSVDDRRRRSSGDTRTTTTIRECILAAITPLGQVVAEPEPTWVWDGYIANGATTALFAKPKAGKTTLLFDLLRALRTGESCAGRATRAARVLYLSEEGRATIGVKRKRFDLDGPNGDHVKFVSIKDVPGAGWADWCSVAVELADDFDLVVIDTYGRFAGFKGDEANGDTGHLERIALLDALTGAGVAVLLVAHERKAEGADITDTGKGGNAFTGVVDVLVFLRRVASDPQARTMEAIGRFDDYTPDEWHIRLAGDRFVSTLPPQPAHAKTAADRIALLPTDEWTTAKEAAPLFDVTAGAAKKALDAAHATGQVDRDGTGSKSTPYRYKPVRGWSSSSSYSQDADDDDHPSERSINDAAHDARVPRPLVTPDDEDEVRQPGGPPDTWEEGRATVQSAIDRYGSEDALVAAFIESFDATEIAA